MNKRQQFIGIAGALACQRYASHGYLAAEDYAAILILAVILLSLLRLIAGTFTLLGRLTGKSIRAGLNQVILTWPTGDAFTVEDALRGIACYGATGSGKSSGSRLWIERGILKTNSGMLVLCSKPEDRQWAIDRATEAGRSRDVILLAEDSPHRVNFMEFETKNGGTARELTKFLMTAAEVIEEDKGKSGRENGAFSRDLNRRIIYNAIVPIRIAHGKVDAPSIHSFVSSAPYSPAQLGDVNWQEGYHHQTMRAAAAKPKSDIDGHDFTLAARFWPKEFCLMDDKPRSSGLLGVNNLLHTFNSGLVRELCSTKTTFTPEDLARGAIIIADFPTTTYGEAGRFIMAGLKYLTQRYILRRTYKPGEPYIIIECDEAQCVANSHDADFILQSRSHGGSLFYLTQSIQNYAEALGKEKADILSGQFATRIFHVVDPTTADYAVRLVGEAMQTTAGGSFTPSQGLHDRIDGKSQWSGNFNSGVRSLMLSRDFMVGRTGGARHRRIVDSYVIRSGQGGPACIHVPWKQLRK